LFCLFKLQQNPDLTLRDFRAEAELYGIPMAGRALHSAKVLLGLIRKDSTPPPVVAPPAVPDGVRPLRRRNGAVREDQNGESIENRVVAAVRQMQSAAGAEAEKLRAAIRQAVAILRRALGD
jgi:hypothetical protein